jgi:urease accessory protein
MRAISLTHSHEAPVDTVTLSYDDRYRRRIALTGDKGTQFTLDLDKVTQLHEGDRLLLDTGDTIEVRAADEALMRAVPRDPAQLARIAWHVGNRHLPCQILTDGLVLRWDHVIADMLQKLDCDVTPFEGPFTPEGGAYGQGRTHSHAH